MSLGDLLWAMVVFYFVFALIWMFVGVITDIFRRHDMGGLPKAGWLLLIFAFPLFGILIYVGTRPMTSDY
jgi:hypothetical protein